MPPRRQLLESILTDERALLSASLWSGLVLLVGVVGSRRLSGAMTIPLNIPIAWASSLVVAATAIYALIAWRESQVPLNRSLSWLPEILTLALPLAWGTAVGAHTSPMSWGGLAALWGMLFAAVWLVHRWFPAERLKLPVSETVHNFDSKHEQQTADKDSVPASDLPPSHLQKRMIIDGVEVIEGEISVEFQPGQKEAILHLSFCPPFSSRPDIDTEDALSGDLEIRAEAVHPFGARLSIRRNSQIEAAETRQVSYFARPAASSEFAA